MKNLFVICILILSVITINAQEKKSKKEIKAEKKARQREEVKNIVDSKTFVFKASNANPMRGRTVNLTSEYDVKVTQDSIFSYLPYFGVAYSVNYGGTDSPMIFKNAFESCDFETTKNGYLVKVSVKNENDRLDYSFHISVTGSTSLNVSSLNRQSISYNGNIEKIKEKEDKK
ncbi:MAG TPA: DUF4251 domain-containing protein [Draconibacterium sp.]|nr:DUF4251 domain-containing protein [Draconibacterium sp.]